MDTSTVIAIGIAALATIVSVVLFAATRRLSRAVDDARSRIGGAPARRRRHRIEALDAALTTLERSSAQAQRERSQLAGALQAAPIGLIVTDDEGVPVFANQLADELLGARQGEAVAQVRLREAIDRAILERKAVVSEVELFTPVRRVLEIAAIPLDFGIESVGAVAYVDDVSDQRRVDAMRRDFISNVSHELKTPLAALAVLAETLADNLDDPEVAGRMAARLGDEADRLSVFVEDILDLSQVEALAAPKEPVDVGTVVAAMHDAMKSAAAERGVQLVVEPIPPRARVSGDRRQLRSMLTNLVDNAIKYSDPNTADDTPRVWIRTRLVGGSLTIEVEDEGIGIPEAHLGRIFERFYRVDRARSRATGGTGLGLSIVRHVAINHGGSVSVDSARGEGSTFTVTLPLWQSPSSVS